MQKHSQEKSQERKFGLSCGPISKVVIALVVATTMYLMYAGTTPNSEIKQAAVAVGKQIYQDNPETSFSAERTDNSCIKVVRNDGTTVSVKETVGMWTIKNSNMEHKLTPETEFSEEFMFYSQYENGGFYKTKDDKWIIGSVADAIWSEKSTSSDAEKAFLKDYLIERLYA